MRLAVMIIAIGLALLLGPQSCTIAAGSAFVGNEDLNAGGGFGVMLAVSFVVAAALAWGFPLISTIIFTVGGVLAIIMASATGFPDLQIWGFVSLGLGLMAWFGRRELLKRTAPRVVAAPSEAASVDAPQAGVLKSNHIAAIIVAVLVGIVIIGAIAGTTSRVGSTDGNNGVGAEQQAEPVAEQATLSVTAAALTQAYDANEVAAQAKYGGQILRVSGTISGITLDAGDNPVIELEGHEPFSEARARFDKSAAQQLGALSKGESVSIQCRRVSEILAAPVLDNCALVASKPASQASLPTPSEEPAYEDDTAAESPGEDAAAQTAPVPLSINRPCEEILGIPERPEGGFVEADGSEWFEGPKGCTQVLDE